MCPFTKKNDLDDPANYRPISVIPSVAKIYEYILKEQLINYFENENLFNPHQFGFRNNLSTTLAIDKLTSYINLGFEEKNYICSQFLDLTKAFDCVSHEILVNKLHYYGFTADSVGLIESYLKNRQQYVMYKNSKSKFLKVKTGVPQGSVLGPVLFLIYVNDLPTSVDDKTMPILFADDTSLTRTNNNIDELLNDTMNMQSMIQKWFVSNQLNLNVTKSETIVFSLRNTRTDDNPQSVKFLGVYLDPKLSWEQHIIRTCKKISKNIYLLRSLANRLSRNILITTYHSLIHSVISYAILIWGHATSVTTVFTLQKKSNKNNYGS